VVKVLGISAYYHDSAAALAVDGRLVAAAQEERFTRVKHDEGFPRHAILYCLAEGGLRLADVDHVVFYDKPFLKFERLLETYVAYAPRGFKSFLKSMPIWLREKLFQKNLLLSELRKIDADFAQDRMAFTEHHFAHAASAFFPSPFEEAVVLTMDGVGEWATTSAAIGRGNSLAIEREIHFPHSLGLLYSAFTYFCGFKVNSGEYKLMGLAPYGTPRFAQTIRDSLIDIKPDGSFRLNMAYFDYCTGLRMTNSRFASLFEGPERSAESQLTQREMDIAASIQNVLEEVVLKMTAALAAEYSLPNLCLAGGVALNCVANGKILRQGAFENIWIQPASGDSGGAVGAALAASHGVAGLARVPTTGEDSMLGSYLGPQYRQEDIERRLRGIGSRFHVVDTDTMISRTAEALERGDAIGWLQGRMEFGPRALGARSILGDPRSPKMQSLLNLKVKYRESFRPFAPSVLLEHVSEWFDVDCESPYMLLVADVAERHRITMTDQQNALFGIDKLNVARSTIPAVTHVDYSARIQTVNARTNPLYHRLISEFANRTGCPVVVNTSFNVRGEPLVCTPEDGFRCFMGTDLDYFVAGNCIMLKSEQDPSLKLSYENRFSLD
jgi:carbamoyltransferase